MSSCFGPKCLQFLTKIPFTDNSWTLKVRRVPGPIPDASDEPVTRPHFNFNNDSAKQRDEALTNWHASLAQFGMSGGDYQEDDDNDDMAEDDGGKRSIKSF